MNNLDAVRIHRFHEVVYIGVGNGIPDHRRQHFRFLAWPLGPDAATRFEHMADAIRTFYAAAPIANYGFRFYSTHLDVPVMRNTTLADLNGVDLAHFLASFFERMVQSGTAYELEGFTVTVENVGPHIPYLNAGGWGQPTGIKYLPDRWRGQGLSEHSRLSDLDPAARATHCGFRAILLAKWNAEGIPVKPPAVWHAEAVQLATAIGNLDGKMKLIDITPILALPEYASYRIVILSTWRRIQFADRGQNWIWPEDHPHKEPEPKTLHLLWEHLDEHFYWVKSPKSFFIGYTSSGAEYLRCMACFQNTKVADLSDHGCQTAGKHQCSLCLEVFSCGEALDMHRKFRNKNYPPCEICQQTTFNGDACFRKHLASNCHPTDFLPPNVHKVTCEVCGWVHRSDRPHDCVGPHGRCRHCKMVFQWSDQRDFHRCAVKRNDTFWEPIAEKRKNGEVVSFTWKSHYFYDFETCKNEELSPRTYKLAVMAWCIRLMIPDDVTRRYVVEQQVCQEIIDKVQTLAQPDVRCEAIPLSSDSHTLRICGKGIRSFVAVVEDVLVNKGVKKRWVPTLWAHNGSKFDVKFLFDYYVNEVKLDLAGSTYTFAPGDNNEPARDQNGDVVWVEPRTIKPQRNVIKISSVGSKVLSLKVFNATYRCSHAHHTMPLRNLPKVFGLRPDVKKGEFPYCRLKPGAWDDPPCPTGLPHLKEYETDGMVPSRRQEVIEWWIEDQCARWARPAFIRECIDEVLLEGEDKDHYLAILARLDYDRVYEERRRGRSAGHIVRRWKFEKELWEYLKSDVDVGALCMEAYHRSAEEMHRDIWQVTPNFEMKEAGKIVSPLDCATAPAWAHRLYTTWFMPDEDLIILTNRETRFVRTALRGGRTDKRANWIKLTPERREAGDRIVYVDFKSLYPSVQKHDAHADFPTHYPVGTPCFIRPLEMETDNERLVQWMGRRTGFLRITTEPLAYSTHPTLHRLRKLTTAEKLGLAEPDDSEKLVFANEPIEQETYAWPEILEAIQSGEIKVLKVHDALLFDKGTDVFDDYVNFFFKLKETAERTGNKGLRALAKLLLNSLWGKLGQRSYPIREWVTWHDRLDYLWKKFQSGEYTVLDFKQHEPHRAWVQYRIEDDVNNANATAPHVAAFVSTWGRVMLHKKLLRQHGQRALYCDTDSAIVYLRAGDSLPYTGSSLGTLTDEVPKILEDAGYDLSIYTHPFIEEAVFVAPKTYALRIKNLDPPLIYNKVVCKGFEPSFKNARELHFLSMKELVWTHNRLKEYVNGKRPLDEEEDTMQRRTYIRDGGRMQMRSNMANTHVAPIQTTITKQLSGLYTKGKTVPWEPRLVQPYGTFDPPHQTFLDFADNAHYA